jgi:TruD family tRNA pseudouridine synthase
MTSIDHCEVAGILSTDENSDNVILHPVLRRHYSSIGIGEVFVQPCPSEKGIDDGRNGQWLLPSAYFAPSWKYLSSCSSTAYEGPRSILGDELIGNIKCTPEDFVVREIALVHGRRQVADLELSPKSIRDTSAAESDALKTKQRQQDTITPVRSPQVESAHFDCQAQRSSLSNHSSLNEVSFFDEFQSILATKFCNTDLNPHDVPIDALRALQRLESNALDFIRSFDETSKLPKTTSFSSCEVRLSFQLSSEQQKQEKTRIHQCFRNAFPLLVAESVVGDSIDRDSIYNVVVKIDTTFYELIPYLYSPMEDLLSLYIYAKYGFEYARDQSKRKINAAPRTNNKSIASSRGSSRYNYGCPLLRLKPNLPRSERRPIHQIVDAKSKNMLGTETFNDFPLETGNNDVAGTNVCATDTDNVKTTTVIRISWTKMAARRSSKKRVREESAAPGSIPRIEKESKFMLCVLRKRQREHLGMINTISAVLKCTPTSIGLAGIKDLQSVSYQFCTLNKFAAQRIRVTRDILSERGIEIAPVREIDHTLNKGDLVGNHFEIFLRNTRRVQLSFAASSSICHKCAPSVVESFVPVDNQHLRSMVDRIRANGFVNFYGEQRVGDPGHRSLAGVRAFDIGKAMLQQNFAKAIDLLMTGRRVIKGVELEGDNIELFRRIWKDTNGNPIATMKALPSGGNSVPRERAVLKGLIRYGKDQPLAAFRCLQRNERLFFINAVRIIPENEKLCLKSTTLTLFPFRRFPLTCKYQSYVWNRMATERMRRYGNVVVVGDLLLPEGSSSGKPTIVTDDDVESKSISNVVLPMPGYDILYPTNAIGQLYQDFLQQENVQFDKNALHDESKARGSYRRLISFAENLTFEVVPSTEQDLKVVDVKFTFDLSKGSYATMFLRELMLKTVARDSTEYTT